ncbi:copper chaperone PCu(A)C [Burkholderia sp. S171]|uniref:copper chaperone PCu(A)C n=1 Tax=Burkholderia sp. S171 TaxID=1641860 RepID=UPI00131C4EE5|nr:copper chaperone PCu(A)C [Burkholderia sp. S171]
MHMRCTILALGLFLIAPLSRSESVAANHVVAEHAWARATVEGADVGVVYMSIVNEGPASDALVSVSSPVSRVAQVHENRVDAQGMTEMRALDRVEIPAHARIDLKPTALHVMLVDLKKPLIYKSTFPITLVFERAGVVSVTVIVEKAGAMVPGDMDGMAM